jgi:hypothetical protein
MGHHHSCPDQGIGRKPRMKSAKYTTGANEWGQYCIFQYWIATVIRKKCTVCLLFFARLECNRREMCGRYRTENDGAEFSSGLYVPMATIADVNYSAFSWKACSGGPLKGLPLHHTFHGRSIT